MKKAKRLDQRQLSTEEGIVRMLKDVAKQNRRSLSQEARARLEASLAASRRSGTATVTALRRLHKRLGGLPPLTDAFLNRAKNEGRQ